MPTDWAGVVWGLYWDTMTKLAPEASFQVGLTAWPLTPSACPVSVVSMSMTLSVGGVRVRVCVQVRVNIHIQIHFHFNVHFHFYLYFYVPVHVYGPLRECLMRFLGPFLPSSLKRDLCDRQQGTTPERGWCWLVLVPLNPTLPGQGKYWPRWLWRQIAEKVIMYVI